MEEERKKIIEFYENHLQKFKNRELTQEEERVFSEFFMVDRYLDHLNKLEVLEISEEKKNMKYFALGWYVYEVLFGMSKNNILPNINV